MYNASSSLRVADRTVLSWITGLKLVSLQLTNGHGHYLAGSRLLPRRKVFPGTYCVVNEDRIIRETRSTRAKKGELCSRFEQREHITRVSAERTIVQPVNAPCNLPDIRVIRVQMDDQGYYSLVFLPPSVFSLRPLHLGRVLDEPVRRMRASVRLIVKIVGVNWE